MQSFNEMWEEVQRLASNSRIRFITLSLLFCILLWFGIKACSSESKERVLYRIGIDNTWYPINLFGKERSMTAFSEDLLIEIANAQEFEVEVIPTTGGIFASLEKRNLDGVISPENITSLGIGKYEFSDPFYLLGPVLVINNDSKIKGIADLNGKSIGVALSSTLVPQISAYSAVFRVYENPLVALDELNKDRIDGVLINALPGYLYTQAFYPGKMKILPTKVREGIKLIIKKDPKTSDLIKKFNQGLVELKKNGRYAQLLKKWDLINTDPNEVEEPPKGPAE